MHVCFSVIPYHTWVKAPLYKNRSEEDLMSHTVNNLHDVTKILNLNRIALITDYHKIKKGEANVPMVSYMLPNAIHPTWEEDPVEPMPQYSD